MGTSCLALSPTADSPGIGQGSGTQKLWANSLPPHLRKHTQYHTPPPQHEIRQHHTSMSSCSSGWSDHTRSDTPAPLKAERLPMLPCCAECCAALAAAAPAATGLSDNTDNSLLLVSLERTICSMTQQWLGALYCVQHWASRMAAERNSKI
jgi:hypothetical protein